LLKTLEEPPGQTRFILTTHAESRVLPTIKSRCLIHRLARPSDTESQAWLLSHQVPEAQAGPLLRAAGDQVQTAMALHEAGWTAERWSGLPQALYAGQAQALSDLAMPEVVSVLQKVCHDALSLALDGTPRYFEVANFPKALNAWRLSQWAKALTDTARHAQHPYHAGLMIDALVSQAQRALQP
jgi:DNA polymerase-3 subunit delta'